MSSGGAMFKSPPGSLVAPGDGPRRFRVGAPRARDNRPLCAAAAGRLRRDARDKGTRSGRCNWDVWARLVSDWAGELNPVGELMENMLAECAPGRALDDILHRQQ
ncbi:unnamed protein product [Gadus morhua 'NCC']